MSGNVGAVSVLSELNPAELPNVSPVFAEHDDFVLIKCASHRLTLVTRKLWLDLGWVACDPAWLPRNGLAAHWSSLAGHRPRGQPSCAEQSLAWSLPSPRRQSQAEVWR